jgi:hypothetical protein
MKLLNHAFVALVLAAPLFALAQSTPVIDQRQANQEQRIEQGVRSGSLTNREAARLEQGQAHVQTMENKAKADGVVTAGERTRIQDAQDNQSKRIAKQKQDRQHDYNHNGKRDRPRN